ncbi:MAG: hypothetical protein H6719_08690 [Sandaracinaceae bacterium]|nr:hypothetical protein [Sandaracinaceae bacterium]
MSNPFDAKAILDALRPSLTGLRGRAIVPEGVQPPSTQSPLGVLAGFVSDNATGPTTVWSGKGFNIVELPNRNMETPPNTPKFQVKLNAYTETLTFTRFENDEPAPNRGNSQPDMDIRAIQYFQSIADAVTKGGIHAETGMWLMVPDPKVPGPGGGPMLARLGVIPHGDSILCQGFSIGQRLENTPPQFEDADTTPFTLDANGNRVNDASAPYLQIIQSAPLPPGITPAIVRNPNVLLQQHLAGTTVLEMDVLILSANPIAGIDGVQGTFEQVGKAGGIVNIPFVVKNANSNSMTCIFWLEKVRDDATGEEFLQVQYSQTVILDFQVLGANGTPVDIKWPHVSVATLREPGAPALP